MTSSIFDIINPTPPPLPEVREMTCSYLESPTGEFLYRYDGRSTRYEGGETRHDITLHRFPVIRRTAKCFVIDTWGRYKFVLLDARKRYAYPTKELAANSFRARCDWRIRILTAQLNDAIEIDVLRKRLVKEGVIA